MKRIIKTYYGRLGIITVTEFTDGNHTEYHVEHSCDLLPSGAWYTYKSEAIKYAQFLAGKY